MAIADITERLGQFWLFEGFSPDELARMGDFMGEQTATSGTDLYRQGDAPDRFYLVERGEVLERGSDAAGARVLHRRAEPGDYVGHRSLMSGTPRRATATVTRGARLLTIEADDFQTLLAMFPALHVRLLRIEVVNRLLAIPLFTSFTEKELFQVADLAREVQFPEGETIFWQGEPSEAFYIIDSGQVIEHGGPGTPGTQSWPKYLAAGNWFGRYGVRHRTTRRATATAGSEVRLFRFEADAFHWLCQWKPAFERALTRPDILGSLHQTGLFSRLHEEELKKLSGFVGLAHFRPGDVLYRQGDFDATLYILYEGEAILRARDLQGNERPLGYLQAGDLAGQSSLFLEEPRDVTVQSTTHSNWSYLSREDLDQFLAENPGVRGRLVLRDAERVEARRRLPRLPWLESGEQVVLRTRRHWFFLATRLAIPASVLLGALTLQFLPLLGILGVLIAIVDGFWILWRIVDWSNDYYVVTTKRVAHREKVLLIREERDETPLDKIQNINIDRGFWGNLTGFGHLMIDTAAAVGVTRVSFTYLRDPEAVKELVFAQVSRLRGGERARTRRAIRDKLEERVGLTVSPAIPRPVVPRPEPGLPAPADGDARERRRLPWIGDLFWIERREEHQTIWRKHWIRLLARIWLPASLLVALVVIQVALIASGELVQLLVMALLIGALLPTLFWLWWGWTDWGNDQYIAASDRLIDIERSPLGFRSERTDTTYDRVQNVRFVIPHPIATVLNYGTVVIYTAGAEGRLDFLYVRNPKRVQAEIFRRVNTYRESQRAQDREDQFAELPDWFAEYDRRQRYSY